MGDVSWIGFVELWASGNLDGLSRSDSELVNLT